MKRYYFTKIAGFLPVMDDSKPVTWYPFITKLNAEGKETDHEGNLVYRGQVFAQSELEASESVRRMFA